MKLGYLGPKGTFTFFAVEHFNSVHNYQLIEKQSLDQLFDALSSKEVDAIFTPFENSIEGSVNRVLDNLTTNSDCHIHDMVSMPISQSILGLYETDVADIEHIISMPVAIAPTGLTGMQRANGEILSAQACEEFGIPYTLSTMSVCSIEEVAKHTKKPFWFQLYVCLLYTSPSPRDRG